MYILERIQGLIASAPYFNMLEFGACDGYHTNQFLRMLTSSGKPFVLHSFEPEQRNFQVCLKSIRHKIPVGSCFQLWNRAIGAESGEKPFYVSGGVKRDDAGRVVDVYYGSSSIRKPTGCLTAWPSMKFTEDKTQVVTLDEFWESQMLGARIDFIWADIQGAEVDLIKGGPKTFPYVRYLYTEYCDSELYEGEVGLDGIKALLPDFEVVEDYGGDVLLHNKALP